MCGMLELQKCIQYGPPESSLTLSRELSSSEATRQLQAQNAKQCVLDKWFV